MSRTWRVRLTRQAESDFLEISRWTAENFGALQTEFYAETVTLAIEALRGGPEVVETKARDVIARGVRTMHVARQGRKGRHFVVFRAAEGQIVEILRLLHDSMEVLLEIAGQKTVVLSDQVKSLDWKNRKARKKGTAPDPVMIEVRAKMTALLAIR